MQPSKSRPARSTHPPRSTTPAFTQGALLETLLEQSNDAIQLLSPDGTILYSSKSVKKILGYSPQDILNTTLTPRIHPDDLKLIRPKWSKLLKDPHGQLRQEFRIKHKNRRWVWVEAKFTNHLDHPQIGAILGNFRDVSDRRQHEKLLALNESKDDFISLASHQLRTPATIVKQYLSMVIDGYVGKIDPETRELLIRANMSNDRQIDIVDDLLRVARLDAGKVKLAKTEINLVPLVQEVINEHLTLLDEREQHATLEYNQPGISANIDRARLKMVLENLLDNAIKYSPTGSSISFSVRRQGDKVAIAVTDQGIGISKHDIRKLFQKFSRLHDPLSLPVSGTGLGLYWAKRIVSLHGGTIRVSSEPGKGSTFTVWLPLKKSGK